MVIQSDFYYFILFVYLTELDFYERQPSVSALVRSPPCLERGCLFQSCLWREGSVLEDQLAIGPKPDIPAGLAREHLLLDFQNLFLGSNAVGLGVEGQEAMCILQTKILHDSGMRPEGE